MIKKYTADIIYDGLGGAHTDTVLIMDGEKVVGLESMADHDAATVDTMQGILLPGLINTHCHLELSHMKGVAPTGTGLLAFLNTVVNYRNVAQEQIDAAIAAGDEEMQREGIVACGDISNKVDTAAVKGASPIRYYTFVEMFDFMQPHMTAGTIAQYKAVHAEQADQGGNRKSYVPHAPYTVSPELFDYIKKSNDQQATVSIHNQETQHENDLFVAKKGGFADWYAGFDFKLDHFEATGQPSIQYALAHLNPDQRNLLVHNTMSTPADIASAHAWSDHIYWATCANANLYIENRLPDYTAFIEADARMTIGTDSLTSNWQLSIWEEIKTIRRYASYVPLELLTRWACHNGAAALGMDDELGSFEIGKSPGINLVSCKLEAGSPIIKNSKVKKIQ